MIKVVCFDVGETLLDETAQWAAWADWLGLPRFTFFGLFGAVIARGEDHRRVLDPARPGCDNDIRHAHAVGLRAVHLRRGPWSLIQSAALTERVAER